MADIDAAVERADPRWPADLPDRLQPLIATAIGSATAPDGPLELSVVLADDQTVQSLNRDYRDKDRPTNVLSFALTEGDEPAGLPGQPIVLGDVLLAYETVALEARQQNKSLQDHVFHLVAHGVLHLLGYDHQVEQDAREMERLEKAILAEFAIADPYGPDS
ncbi:MAG: rRNA maturation RNase YbeY [Pseudomonadota bacterium]